MNWIRIGDYTINKNNVDAIELAYDVDLIFHMSGGKKIEFHYEKSSQANMWRQIFLTMAVNTDEDEIQEKLRIVCESWRDVENCEPITN